jgi:hypothetical protein
MLLAFVVAGCSEPPPEAFLGGAARRDARPLDLGANAAGEPCTLLRGAVESQVFCGTYVDPAGRVGRPAHDADALAVLTDSPWRRTIDRRFLCAQPVAADVLGSPG